MRLSELDIECIIYFAKYYFGTEIQVFLFGVRTNDHHIGGSINLFIRNINSKHLNSSTKEKFITALRIKIDEQDIEVILGNHLKKESAYCKMLYETGIQLC